MLSSRTKPLIGVLSLCVGIGTTASAVAIEGEAPDTKPSLSEKQRRILDYLRSNAGAKAYFKSRLIADDLDFSAKEVDASMRPILGGNFDVTVEKWGYSSGTTWKVTA